MKWYRVYLHCIERDERNVEYSCGRHGYVNAENKEEAIKKVSYYYKHQRVKVIRAELSNNYNPNIPDKLTGTIYYGVFKWAVPKKIRS